MITLHDSEWTTFGASKCFKVFRTKFDLKKKTLSVPAWRMGSGDVLVQLEMAKVNFMAVAKVIRWPGQHKRLKNGRNPWSFQRYGDGTSLFTHLFRGEILYSFGSFVFFKCGFWCFCYTLQTHKLSKLPVFCNIKHPQNPSLPSGQDSQWEVFHHSSVGRALPRGTAEPNRPRPRWKPPFVPWRNSPLWPGGNPCPMEGCCIFIHKAHKMLDKWRITIAIYHNISHPNKIMKNSTAKYPKQPVFCIAQTFI